MSVISSQQLAAFHATEYRVDDLAGPFTLRIGERSLALQRLHEALGAASSAYLTAWNPLGETAPPELNAERQTSLQRDLVELGIFALPGEGRDPATGYRCLRTFRPEGRAIAVGSSMTLQHHLKGEHMGTLERFRGCLLGLARGDAVGTTVEFRSRGSFVPLTDMIGNGPFSLQPGQWTDDTSMALCLATSLLECGGFDAADKMRRDCRWKDEGYLSSTGECFDIGTMVSMALRRF